MTEGLNWTELKNLAWRFRLKADYVLRKFVIHVCHRYMYQCITDLGLFCREICPIEWSNLCRCWCFEILLKPLLKITLSIKNFLRYLGNKQSTKSSIKKKNNSGGYSTESLKFRNGTLLQHSEFINEITNKVLLLLKCSSCVALGKQLLCSICILSTAKECG